MYGGVKKSLSNKNKKKRLTQEEIDLILSSDKNSYELSKEMNRPASTIRRYRQQNNINRHKLLSDLSSREVEEIIQMYNLGYSAKIIGEKKGWSKTSMLKLLNDNGIDTTVKPLLTEEQHRFIVENYHNFSAATLAKQFNVSASYVAALWRKNDLSGKKAGAVRTYSLNEDYFKKLDSPDKAYFLGWLSSDGCLWNDGSRYLIKLTVQARDENILKLFFDSVDSDKLTYTTTRNGFKYKTLEICSKGMYSDLQSYGLMENKTYSFRFVPLDTPYISHFVRGYFDGDGHITRPSKDVLLPSDFSMGISSNYQCMKQMSEYLQTLDVSSSVYIGGDKYNGEHGELSINNIHSFYNFISYIYKDCGEFKLERKIKKAKEFMEVYCSKYNKYNLFEK